MKKILFILPVIGQPRDAKRVDMIKRLGFDTKVCSFERDYHKGRLPNSEIISLGKFLMENTLVEFLKFSKLYLQLENK